jgi:hypothetical protein
MDECLSNSTCDANATCNNTEGSYACTCDSGYRSDGFSCHGMHRTEIVIIVIIRGRLFKSWLTLIQG